MRVFPSNDLRNVALVGHGHAGKTTLASAMLFAGGATQRFLRTEEGNTVTDFDDEEIQRRHTISTGIAHLEWDQRKINIFDTPGLQAFLHDTRAALSAADGAIIVVDGVAGVQVQTETVWDMAAELELPVMFAVTKQDLDRANYTGVCTQLAERFGRHAVPLEDQAAVIELIAEEDDELMQEFFDTGHLIADHHRQGLKQALWARHVFPIVPVSAVGAKNVNDLLRFIAEYFPAPACLKREGRAVELTGHPSAVVFKTMADAYAGRVTYFKVMSGTVKNDSHLINGRSHVDERLAGLGCPMGKTSVPVSELHGGDIGVVSKLKDTLSGDTLHDKGHPREWPAVRAGMPAIAYAISAKTRNDEDRLATAIHKILEEDPSLRFYRDPATKEFLLAGNGQQHVEVIVSKLRKRYQVDVELHQPKIPYRETIRGNADVQGRHKKQTGGHGQFGDCRIRMEPLDRGQNFEFVNAVFGGAVPRQFIPAVEKGVVEAAERGYLAGYPVVDFKVTLYDGSYHDVDSSEMSFKQAARKAFRLAMEQAKPALLEPVMKVTVTAPVEFAGDLMGDLNSRRGRVAGMDNNGGQQIVRALVPMAEMLDYQNDLTAMTQGRGSFIMDFDHYDYVPPTQAQKIIEKAQALRAGMAVEDED